MTEKCFIIHCCLYMNKGDELISWKYAFFNIILVLEIAPLVSAK